MVETEVIRKKVEYWKAKLIDLSKKNNLISYKFIKSRSIKITEPQISYIIFDLYDEKNIFFAKMEKKDLKKRMWKSLEEDKIIEKKLISLYRRTRENFQESGINSFFVSLYTLKYKENENSEDYLEAPIFLFPVTIEKLNYSSKEKHRFEIVSSSDDLIVNPALIEKLKNDFSIEVPKFTGEINKFISQFREVVSGKEDWEIVESCYLDIFSYQKYVMYEDLEKHQKLIFESNLIKKFVGDEDVPQNKISDEFATDINGIDVLSADSSQKEAIELAKSGETFVLQGPPGTGKSQTIVNIIAALMEQRKKILFVSQKMAALNVVQKRLEKIGLDRYCLNLHNYKGNRKEVIKQLINELETSPKIKERAKKYSFTTYIENQDKINSYYKFLCEKQSPQGFSVYEIRGELAKLSQVELIPKKLLECLEFTEEGFGHLLNTINKIDSTREEILNPMKNIYFSFKEEKDSSVQRERLKNLIEELSRNSKFINELLLDIKKKTQVTIQNIDFLQELHNKVTELNEIKNIPEYLLSNNFYRYKKIIHKLFEAQTIIDSSLKKLNENVRDNFLTDDTQKFKKIFESTNILSRLFNKKYKKTKEELQKYSKQELNHRGWIEVFQLKEAIKSNQKIRTKEVEENSQVVKLLGSLDIINLGNLNKFVNFLNPIYKWAEKAASENQFNLIKYIHINRKSLSKVQNFIELTKNISVFFETDFFDSKKDLKIIQNNISQILEQRNTLNSMLIFKQNFSQLITEVQEFTIKFFETETKNTLKDTFLKSYYSHLLDKILTNRNIQTPKSEIKQFRRLDVEVRDSQRFKIMNSIEKEQPKENYKSYGLNEVSILKREGEKKRKIKPIRELLEKIPNLVFTLKPCFMMSPLSVSQYINPSTLKFDVVIFDEASQIVPEDAVPSLLRSKQAIVVGDTRQLPPTSFFIYGGDETIEEEIEDLESFLSECSTKFVTKPLLWHYRSRNEDLIAFSNKFFYENRLITFPSPKKSSKLGLEFRYVENAVYDRGKTRKNRQEAEEVVKTYKEIKKDYPKKSVGIIAFSMAQESAIQEAFNSENIDINGKIDSHLEDLFIKNLETVQGDERDIIILCIGYGKDENGKLSYNFGPINKEGGYKRLNVAITRSRYKTIVISSLDPKELDDKKLKSEGAKLLKKYLNYAKLGGTMLDEMTQDLEFEGELEESVYNVLTEEGLEVESQVGCSGYKIDLAIKNPKNKEDYVLGIECDGSQYLSSKFARDRDKIRQQVLESLGWNIYRIWSDDWIKNRESEVKLIKDKVKYLSSKRTSLKEVQTEKFQKVESVKNFEEKTFRELYKNYKVAVLPLIKINNFFDMSKNIVKKRMIKILKVESPLERIHLYKKITDSFGILKLGKKIIEACDFLVKELEEEGNVFIYGETISKNKIQDMCDVRISTEDVRPFVLIPKEELAKAIYDVLKNTKSATRDTLVKDVAKEIFHNYRIGSKIKEKIDESLKYLLEKNLITEEDGGKFKNEELHN